MRITKKVFLDLAIWMVLFGVIIGVIFPWFVTILGVPMEIATKPGFYIACLCAGALAGIINYFLARSVVGSRILILANGMDRVENRLRALSSEGKTELCSYEDCSIQIDSEDIIGKSANTYNRLVKTLADSLQTQQAVRNFSDMLASTLDLETLSFNSLQMFIDHSGSNGGAIFCDDAGQMKSTAVLGIKEPDKVAASDHIRVALRRGHTQKIVLPQGIQMEGILTDFRPGEILVLPSLYKGVPLGVVVLGKTGSFQEEELIRLEFFRQGFGLALNNALAHDRLQHLAALDPLTGVYNRRFGLGRLHEEFERAIRSSIPFGLLMLDIDHFKSVNDTYGHQVGDRILKSISSQVRTLLREGDILVRYGGEEFLAILPAASSEDLRFIGERIRRSAEESAHPEGDHTIRVTVSLGGAAYPNQNVEEEHSLLQLADEALYQAKETGRNRVIIAN